MEESSGHVTKGGAKRFALLQRGSKLTVPPATWKWKLSLRGIGKWGGGHTGLYVFGAPVSFSAAPTVPWPSSGPGR